jgi:hypothetical protein
MRMNSMMLGSAGRVGAKVGLRVEKSKRQYAFRPRIYRGDASANSILRSSMTAAVRLRSSVPLRLVPLAVL